MDTRVQVGRGEEILINSEERVDDKVEVGCQQPGIAMVCVLTHKGQQASARRSLLPTTDPAPSQEGTVRQGGITRRRDRAREDLRGRGTCESSRMRPVAVARWAGAGRYSAEVSPAPGSLGTTFVQDHDASQGPAAARDQHGRCLTVRY